MNDLPHLPPELWTIIFKRFNLVDQNKFRLVSSRWKNIVDSIKVNDLMISDSADSILNSWFITNEPISLKNRLWNSNLSTSFQLPSRFYESVRRLKLNNLIDSTSLRWVEKFDQLEQLEIYCILSIENVLISLPCLNKLYISSISDESSSRTEFLVFNAPKLQFAYFGYKVFDAVRLIHFDCLEHLEFKNGGGYSDLNHFKNLKIVHCHLVMDISLDLMKSLIRLPKLAELHCNALGITYPDYYGNPNDSEVERLRILFNYFSKQIKVLRILNLKLYFEGVLIKSGKEFDDCNFGQRTLSLHMKNYDSLADCIPWFQEMDISELFESTSEFPININQKYPNITSVRVDGTVEEEKLIWFLRGCRNLTELIIYKQSLTQQFYDQLVDWHCGLETLSIGCNAEINFDFLYKLEFLFRFSTDCSLSMDLALDLMPKLKHCVSLEFGFKGKQEVRIEKVGKNDFKIYIGSTNTFKVIYHQ